MGIFIYIFVMGQMINDVIYKSDQTIDIMIGNKYNKKIAVACYEKNKISYRNNLKLNITKLYGQKKKEKKECNQKETKKIKG